MTHRATWLLAAVLLASAPPARADRPVPDLQRWIEPGSGIVDADRYAPRAISSQGQVIWMTDRSVVLRDLATGRDLAAFPLPLHAAREFGRSLAFSPDGRSFAVALQDAASYKWQVSMFVLPEAAARWSVPFELGGSEVAFSPGGEELRVLTPAGVVGLSAGSGKETRREPFAPGLAPLRLLAAGVLGRLGDELVLVDVHGQTLWRRPYADGEVVQIAPDLRSASIRGADRALSVVDIPTQQVRWAKPAVRGAPETEYWLPGGGALLVLQWNGVARNLRASDGVETGAVLCPFLDARPTMSSNGRWLLNTLGADSIVNVCDLEAQPQVHPLEGAAELRSLALTRDGSRVVGASEDRLLLWDAQRGVALGEPMAWSSEARVSPEMEGVPAQAVALIPDGPALNFPGVTVWTLKLGEGLQSRALALHLPYHWLDKKRQTPLACGDLLAIDGGPWKTALVRPPSLKASIRLSGVAVGFTPDCRGVVVARKEGRQLALLDAKSGAQQATFGVKPPVDAYGASARVRFSGGSMLVVEPHGVLLFDVKTRALLAERSLDPAETLLDADFGADAVLALVSTSRWAGVRYFDPRALAPLGELPLPSYLGSTPAYLGEDVALAGERVVVVLREGPPLALTLPPVAKLPARSQPRPAIVHLVGDANTLLVLDSRARVVAAVDRATGASKPSAVAGVDSFWLTGGIASDAGVIVSAQAGTGLTVFRPLASSATGFDKGRTFPVTAPMIDSADVSSDGRRAVTASTSGLVQLWDLTAGTILKTFPGGDALSRVALAPDGHRVYGHNKAGLVAWDAETGQPIWAVNAGAMTLFDLAPSGRELATATEGGAVALMDSEGHVQATFDLALWGDRCTGLGFSSDGTRLYIGTTRGGLEVLATGGDGGSAENAETTRTLGHDAIGGAP